MCRVYFEVIARLVGHDIAWRVGESVRAVGPLIIIFMEIFGSLIIIGAIIIVHFHYHYEIKRDFIRLIPGKIMPEM
ncbi:MAG: hypothetical protein QXK88_07260 [Desulfurococcaceae archaeon]